MNVSYASALLVPCWQLMTLVYMLGRLPWIMLLIVRQLMILNGGLDNFPLVASMLGCTCQAVRGFPTFAPCLEHICAGGGGGGASSVANMGLVLLWRRGLYIYALYLCYL